MPCCMSAGMLANLCDRYVEAAYDLVEYFDSFVEFHLFAAAMHSGKGTTADTDLHRYPYT